MERSLILRWRANSSKEVELPDQAVTASGRPFDSGKRPRERCWRELHADREFAAKELFDALMDRLGFGDSFQRP